jgi:hypothetical protein
LPVSRTTGKIVSQCTLADANCDAVCHCADGYSGEFCELDPVTLRRRRKVRSNLILSLGNLTALEDVNEDSVSSWSAALYSLCLRPHELSEADIQRVKDIANVTLQHARSLRVTNYADLAGVLQATDAAASLLHYNYNPNDYRDEDFNTTKAKMNNTAAGFLPVVGSFGDLVAGVMVLGENETSFVYDNFRLSVKLFAQVEDIAQYAVPQLPAEAQLGLLPTTVALQASGNVAAPVVSVKVLSASPRAYAMDTTAYVSAPVRVQVQALYFADASVTEHLSRVKFTFRHNEPQPEFVLQEVRNFTSVCTARNASRTFAYTCPDSGHVIRHNCSQGAGVHVGYCIKRAASCAHIQLATADITINPRDCAVLRATADSTVCECTVRAPVSGARRALATVEQGIFDDTGATDMMASSVFIASDFVDTFSAADKFSGAGVKAVLIVMLLLSALWVPGLLVIGADCMDQRRSPEGKIQAQPQQLEAQQTVVAYVQSTVPKVFEGSASLWHRIANEILEHHFFFRLFTANSPVARRQAIQRGLTTLTLMLFLTAVLFDVSNPGDDGTCSSLNSEDSCLRRRSPFNYSQTYCTWSPPDTADAKEQCAYSAQPMSMTALFYMTVLATVISSVLSIPVDYLFSTMKAPTANSLGGSKVSNMARSVASGVRRVSNAGRLALVKPVRLAAVKPASSIARFSTFARSADEVVVANREIPTALVEVSKAARASMFAVAKQANMIALDAAASDRRLRSTLIRPQNSPNVTGAIVRNAEPVVVPAAALGVGDAALLLQDIAAQRALMNDGTDIVRQYDAQWGVMTTSSSGRYEVSAAAAQTIADTVQEATAEAARLDAELSNYSVEHAGLEILFLFMMDLLGRTTPAAKVFREKFGQEFSHSRVVIQAQKYLCAALLLGLNAFFIYFILLKGFQKGRTWQYQYLYCCLVQLAVDLLLFETVECIWLNIMVPQFVHEEVRRAAKTLHNLTLRVAKVPKDVEQAHLCHPKAEEQQFFLNAPAHLFVSVKLAKAHPLLLESIIVGSYRHYLPGSIAHTWPHFTDGSEKQVSTWSAFPRQAVRALSLSLQLFITTPYVYQRVLMRFVQPMLFSGAGLVFYSIIESTVALTVLSLAAGGGLAYAALRLWQATVRANRPLSEVAPVEEEPRHPQAVFIDTTDHWDQDSHSSSIVLSEESSVTLQYSSNYASTQRGEAREGRLHTDPHPDDRLDSGSSVYTGNRQVGPSGQSGCLSALSGAHSSASANSRSWGDLVSDESVDTFSTSC